VFSSSGVESLSDVKKIAPADSEREKESVRSQHSKSKKEAPQTALKRSHTLQGYLDQQVISRRLT